MSIPSIDELVGEHYNVYQAALSRLAGDDVVIAQDDKDHAHRMTEAYFQGVLQREELLNLKLALEEKHLCVECGGLLLAVSSGAVCENGCGKIFQGVALPPGRAIKQSPFQNIGRLIQQVEKDWFDGPLPVGLPVAPDRRSLTVKRVPSKFEAVKRVKKQMSKLGVTVEDLVGVPSANGNGTPATKSNGDTRWQRINGQWYQVPQLQEVR